ncbi:MAG: hypothetical protein CM1200mP18_06650 [Gammaproteobacteria bacterium]|nr:MAG: hypothetical protein CM1200mP18_06650 [Gammaproteobacteria bacterium]
MLHYPAVSGDPKPGPKFRAGAHTDVGMMTILRMTRSWRPSDQEAWWGWIDAPAVDDSFILNIGDLLMRWSNDRLVLQLTG